MKKLLIAGAAVVVLAVAGYFGVTAYAKQRAEREVAASFEMVRASGGTGSYGKVDFDLWSRTLTVADVSVQFAGAPPTTIKAGRIVATGVGQPKPGHVSAQRIEISGIEAEAALAAMPNMRMSYRVPSIRLDGYSGPAALLRRVDSSSALDLSRLTMEHMVATSAEAVTIPSFTLSYTPDAAQGATAMPASDYAYSDIAARTIRDGRIAEISIGKMGFTTKSGPPMTVGMERFTASGIDLTPMLAVLDPAGTKDESIRQVYKQVSVGPYTASLTPALRMRIESMSLDDMGIVPAKLPIADFVALMEAAPPPGSTPSPAAARAILEKVGTLYQGLAMGRFEMRGMSMTLPDGTMKFAGARINGLAKGRFAELALEGLEGESGRNQPFRMGLFALKGFDIAGMLRMSGQLAADGQQPSPEQMVAMLKLLEGIEMKDLSATYDRSARPVRVEALAVSWGQYVGALPTQARVTVKTSGPIDQVDDEPFLTLTALGIKEVSAGLDLGAQWTESNRVFELTPASFELVNLLVTRARFGLGNVGGDMFSLDPVKVMQAAAGIEVGPVEVSLQDAGALDLGIQQYAKANGLSRAAAQANLITELKQTATILTQASPDLAPVFAAAAKFIETPRSTLSVKITPNGRVGLLEMMQLSPDQALGALSRFTIEASVK